MEFNATLSLLFFYLISSSLLFRMGEQGEKQKNHGREGIFTYLIYARSNMLCSDPNGVSVGNQQHQTQIHRPLDLNILSFFNLPTWIRISRGSKKYQQRLLMAIVVIKSCAHWQDFILRVYLNTRLDHLASRIKIIIKAMINAAQRWEIKCICDFVRFAAVRLISIWLETINNYNINLESLNKCE